MAARQKRARDSRHLCVSMQPGPYPQLTDAEEGDCPHEEGGPKPFEERCARISAVVSRPAERHTDDHLHHIGQAPQQSAQHHGGPAPPDQVRRHTQAPFAHVSILLEKPYERRISHWQRQESRHLWEEFRSLGTAAEPAGNKQRPPSIELICTRCPTPPRGSGGWPAPYP